MTGTHEIDVTQLASRYIGHNKTERMLFIAARSTDPEMVKQAITLAVGEIKQGTDTAKYASAVEISGGAVPFDVDWVREADRSSATEIERARDELNSARTNMLKESIRTGHSDLGDALYERGELQAALKSYVRCKDYCVNSGQSVLMFLNVIKVSVELRQYANVTTYALRGQQQLGAKTTDLVTLGQFRAAHGLSLFHSESFLDAAECLLQVPAAMGSTYLSVMAPEDVATYGALAALATFDRKMLREKVLENASFRGFLEYVPHVRKLVLDFAQSKYGACLQALDVIKDELDLDMHLSPHVKILLRDIRNRALVQYCKPYSSVRLPEMALAFGSTIDALELELVALIESKKINARLDSFNKVLSARSHDERARTYDHALEVTEKFNREANILLLRMFMLKSGLVHKKPASRTSMLRGAGLSRDTRGGGDGFGGGGGGYSMRNDNDMMDFEMDDDDDDDDDYMQQTSASNMRPR